MMSAPSYKPFFVLIHIYEGWIKGLVVAILDSSFCFVPCFSSILTVYPLFSIDFTLSSMTESPLFFTQTYGFCSRFFFCRFF